MITLPPNFSPTKVMGELIEFFNKLEKDLQYPNCEGHSDQKKVLEKAEYDLIIWGKI